LTATPAHPAAGGDPPDALVARARDAGVNRIIAVGSGIQSCRAALEVAAAEEGVFAALGIHPHQAADGESLDELEGLFADERAVAVGEIGLDFYRDYAPREAQRSLLSTQLELARRLRKPVVIHTRGADEETAAALATFAGTVVLHCFSSPSLLPIALDRGYYVSFAGNVTYPNAGELRAVATRVPNDRILAETDSPYLSPQPRRGRRNEPAYVVHTVAALAAARGVEPPELERQIDENAAVAFGLP
jgi:TatD DNase family protein